MEIESRLLPCGLHVVGSPPTAAEAIATLVNIAEIDRPDANPPVAGLPGILARTIGRNVEEIYLNNNKARRRLCVYCLLLDGSSRTALCGQRFLYNSTGNFVRMWFVGLCAWLFARISLIASGATCTEQTDAVH